MGEATVAASNAYRVLSYARGHGIETSAPWLEATRFDMEARIPARRMFELWSDLARRSGKTELGLEFAKSSSIEDLHLLGYAIATAPTVAEALATLVKYSALLSDSGHYQLAVEGRVAHLRYFDNESPALGVRLSRETAFAQVVRGLRRLTGMHVEPFSMSFRHPAPANDRPHRELFGGVVRFGEAVDCLTFHREVLDAVPGAANPRVWEYLCAQAEQERRRLGRPFLPRLRGEITRRLAMGNVPNLPAMAAHLGMSERSLRRALSREGTTYREVTDDLRRNRAEQLLRDETRTITEIAYECGFHDASAFTRACIRWFGRPPRALRLAQVTSHQHGRRKN